jgi:magnesium transporter
MASARYNLARPTQSPQSPGMAKQLEDTASDPAEPEPAAAPPKVRTLACLAGVSLERGVPTESIREYIREPENLVWVDVTDPGPEELSMLLEEFGFHPLALEDVARAQQRAKVDEYKGYLFVVMYGVLPSGAGMVRARQVGNLPQAEAELCTVEVDLFIGRNYLVSAHHGKLPALDEAAARWTRGGQMLREGIGFLVYTVIDALIDAYFPLIDAVEQQVTEMEVELFTTFKADTTQRLLHLKRSLVALRRVVYPLREVFHVFLRPEHPFFSAATRVYLHDVYDHILRILDRLDIEREMVASTTEAYLTLSSNRLNLTVKKLTVVTVCVAILGAVFGAWGMNFEVLPMTASPWGFWVVVAGTMALVAAVMWIGRRLDWL